MTDLHNVAAELADHIVPVADLETWPGNARIGDLDRIALSLMENTQYRAILVQESTNRIMAGNQTYRAATERLGWTHIAVQTLDVSDAKAREIVLMDNRAADAATYDDTALYSLIMEHVEAGGDLIATGYDDADLAVLRQVSGALSAEAGDFLSDFGTDGMTSLDENAQTRETGMVSLVFSLSEEDKATVVGTLRDVQSEHGFTTMVEALVEVCDGR